MAHVAQIDAIANRLHTTSRATAPEASEKAVCDAFAAMGFVATHIEGNGAPDGLLDAPLGLLAYRAILECKTAHADTTVLDPRLEEPALSRAVSRAVRDPRRSAVLRRRRLRGRDEDPRDLGVVGQ